MLPKTHILGAISGLVAVGIASSASASAFPECLFSVEAGYARFHHSNDLDHDEFNNITFNGTPSTSYKKRQLEDSNGFYLRAEARPLESSFGFGLQYSQTGHNHLHVSRNVIYDFTLSPPFTAITGTDTYKVDTKHQTLLAMMYFYPLEQNDFVPYIGVGLGASRNKVSTEILNPASGAGTDIYDDHTRIVPAWALQLGGRYYLKEDMYVNANYQFIDFGEVRGTKVMHETGTTPFNLKGHLRDHTFMVGLGYQF